MRLLFLSLSFVLLFNQFLPAQSQLSDDDILKMITKTSMKDNPNHWLFINHINKDLTLAKHKSSAKRYLKNGNKKTALHHYMLGLSKATKKRQVKRFKKVFTPELSKEVMTVVNTEMDSIRELIGKQTFIEKAKTEKCYIDYLKYLQKLNKIKLSNDNLLAYEISSYNEEEMNKALEAYNHTADLIAPCYYNLAIQQEILATKKADWKKISSYYAIAQIYKGNYEDAKDREGMAVEKSIYDVAVYPESLRSSTYRRLDKSLQLMIKDELSSSLNRDHMRHIRLVSESMPTDFRINLAISDVSVTHSGTKSDNVNYEREITTGKDSNGNEIKSKVKANVTYYSKENSSRAKIFAEIVDNSTGEIKYSETFQGSSNWHTKWYKLTGNDKALTKKQKRRLPYRTQPETTPSDVSLIQDAIDGTVKNVCKSLNSNFLYVKGGISH
ncbi:hypothetical protein [Flavivirga spongiicola]|uniref:Curli production assembly/transport component CsgG n=1 Tax=Flavivirga spongiicola TaxID=421621 RepID=A0ABU7XYH2_9FLAO|nr:hypothetical protein [Flavivirga sp. MEBiC05379]MDO5980593.1 hypothetical protein [Flavivirga sp. MEBiC05379]